MDAVCGDDQICIEFAFGGEDACGPVRVRRIHCGDGDAFRVQAARLLAAAGSADPEQDAWTLIAWIEGTAFYTLAGAGATALPSVAVLRAQLTRLLAGSMANNAGWERAGAPCRRES